MDAFISQSRQLLTGSYLPRIESVAIGLKIALSSTYTLATQRAIATRTNPGNPNSLEEDAMRMSLGVLGIVVALILVAPSHTLAQTDPTVGHWKLNLAKSKYDPGPAPKSETRTYDASGKNGIKARFDRVDAAGKTVTITYDAQYDGKDVPYIGSPDADTIALTRVDARTVNAVLKKGGKVVQTTKAVTSVDGKTRSLTTTGTNAAGQKINNVTVFDKM